MLAVKSTSADVNSVPSCQVIPERILHVVSIVPSGFSRQSPFSVLGTCSAFCACTVPLPSSSTRPALTMSSTRPTPAPGPIRTLSLSAGTSSLKAIVMRFGPALGALPPATSSDGRCEAGAAHPRTSVSTSRLTEQTPFASCM